MAQALIHLVKYYLGVDKPRTQTTQAERNRIAYYARGKTSAVEIGVFEGVTTGTIASALDAGATLYAIDPFLSGRVGICWGKPIAKREACRAKPRCQIKFLETYSSQACQQLSGSFDFLFIDGDHSWDGIEQDWSDWSPRVVKGGIIGLHDTIVPNHNPGVAELGSHKYFVQNIRHDDRFRIVEQVDSLTLLERL